MADKAATNAMTVGAMALGGPTSAAAAGQLALDMSTFVKFCQRIDEIVRDLKGAGGLPSQVTGETLTRANFGGGQDGWVEAAGISRSYNTVVSDLEELLKVMTSAIEGMGIAVRASREGYDSLEQGLVQRMMAIRQETEVHYEKARKGARGQTAGEPGQDQQSGDTSGSSGLS